MAVSAKQLAGAGDKAFRNALGKLVRTGFSRGFETAFQAASKRLARRHTPGAQ